MTLLALAVGGRGLVDPEEPVLYADDGALLRGRAAFETIRVYSGVPFKLDDHIRRMQGSAERIELPPVSAGDLRGLAELALGGTDHENVVLRLFWTPGREGEDSPRPLTLALVSPIPADLEEIRERGMYLVSLSIGIDPKLRSGAPWLLGGVKSTSYAVNMAAEQEARRRGADDAVFLGAGNVVLEGPVTNVWWRHGDTLFTPSLDVGILAGVTRATVVELAAALGYTVREGVFTLADLAGAEEAFTSSSVREIMPCTRLDDRDVGDGKPGAAARAVQDGLRRVAEGS